MKKKSSEFPCNANINRRHFLSKTSLGIGALVLGSSASASTELIAQGDHTISNAAGSGAPPDLMKLKYMSENGYGFMSDAIHMGEQSGYSTTPIHNSVNINGIYQRGSRNNPTLNAFHEKIRVLEGAEATYSGTCGMAIILQTLHTLLSTGDRVVVHHTIYSHTNRLLRDYRDRFGIELEIMDMKDLAKLRKTLQKKKTKMVYFEPYANPSMEVLDAPSIIQEAKEVGALSVIDNSFLSPYYFRPLQYGADLVLHSATKYISGDGGAMGGVVSGSDELIGEIRSMITSMGGILRPFDASMISQGLKTLGIRMERHSASALEVARYLEGHPRVARVRYGGLPSWEGYEVGSTYLHGFGGMMGIEWKDPETDGIFRERGKICQNEGSFGDPVSLVRRRGQGYTRISIGLEDTSDIIADFEQALA